jgi:hypothetical protein
MPNPVWQPIGVLMSPAFPARMSAECPFGHRWDVACAWVDAIPGQVADGGLADAPPIKRAVPSPATCPTCACKPRCLHFLEEA